MKDKHLQRSPGDLVSPNLNVDVDAFYASCRFLESNLSWLVDLNEVNEIDVHFAGIYFDRLSKALRILNEMINIPQQAKVIGLALITPEDTLAIFPDTPLDPRWVNICIYGVFLKIIRNASFRKPFTNHAKFSELFEVIRFGCDRCGETLYYDTQYKFFYHFNIYSIHPCNIIVE